MELRHLRYFVAVAEELSFSRAAEQLHVSQPPLSRQIRDLEAELNVKLFDRNRQTVRLTPIGLRVLARSRRLIREAESLLEDAKNGDEVLKELQIGYAPSPTAMVIAKVLARYHEMSPRTRVTLHDLTESDMLSRLRAGKLDAALTIRPFAREMRGLKFDCIRRHPIGIICPLSDPLARKRAVRASAIASTKLVVYRAKEFPEYHQMVSRVLGVGKRRLITGQECTDALSVVAAVESGCGPAVVGEFIVGVAGDRVRFVPFLSKAHFLDVGLLYRQNRITENLEQLIAACTASKDS